MNDNYLINNEQEKRNNTLLIITGVIAVILLISGVVFGLIKANKDNNSKETQDSITVTPEDNKTIRFNDGYTAFNISVNNLSKIIESYLRSNDEEIVLSHDTDKITGDAKDICELYKECYGSLYSNNDLLIYYTNDEGKTVEKLKYIFTNSKNAQRAGFFLGGLIGYMNGPDTTELLKIMDNKSCFSATKCNFVYSHLDVTVNVVSEGNVYTDLSVVIVPTDKENTVISSGTNGVLNYHLESMGTPGGSYDVSINFSTKVVEVREVNYCSALDCESTTYNNKIELTDDELVKVRKIVEKIDFSDDTNDKNSDVKEHLSMALASIVRGDEVMHTRSESKEYYDDLYGEDDLNKDGVVTRREFGDSCLDTTLSMLEELN